MSGPVPIPGWTLPGVLTTGGLQTLVRTQLVCPGDRVLLAGTGPLNLQVACELLARGVKPVAVLDSAPPPWSAAWRDRWQMLTAAPGLLAEGMRMLWTLRRAGVPVLWSTRLIELSGIGPGYGSGVAGPHHCGRCRRAERRVPAGGRAGTRARRPASLRRSWAWPSGDGDRRGRPHLARVGVRGRRRAAAGWCSRGDGARPVGRSGSGARSWPCGAGRPRTRPCVAARPGHSRTRCGGCFRCRRSIPARSPMQRSCAAARRSPRARCAPNSRRACISLPALKKATRAGMGRCQGRFCAATVARLCPGAPERMVSPRRALRCGRCRPRL